MHKNRKGTEKEENQQQAKKQRKQEKKKGMSNRQKKRINTNIENGLIRKKEFKKGCLKMGSSNLMGMFCITNQRSLRGNLMRKNMFLNNEQINELRDSSNT